MQRVSVVIALVAASVSATCFAARTHGDEHPIWDAKATCPSGRFAVEQLAPDVAPTGPNLLVHDNTSGATYRLFVNTPFFSLRWTPDCNALVAIEHIVGGSQVRLLQFDGGAWHSIEIQPPDATGYCDVLQCHIGQQALYLTYKLSYEESVGHATGYYLCSFALDLRSHAISGVRSRRVSKDAYVALHRKA